MPGSEIVIITQGGGTRTTAVVGYPYPVVAGDAAENVATSGPARYCIFTNTAMVTEDIYVPAGEKHTFTESGAVVVP
jgi:hypothetical protein